MRDLVAVIASLLTLVDAFSPQCDGTLSANGRACCPISCGGQCGGAICSADAEHPLSEEARARCCTDVLLTVAPPCTESGGAPCTMPAELSKDQTPCSSGLDNDLPYEACLSYCAMAAHCAKCKCKGCALCQAGRPPMRPVPKPPSPPLVYAHLNTATPDALGCVLDFRVTRFDPRSFTAQIGLNMWVPGMKVLVMDKETTGIVSMVYTQTQILQVWRAKMRPRGAPPPPLVIAIRVPPPMREFFARWVRFVWTRSTKCSSSTPSSALALTRWRT